MSSCTRSSLLWFRPRLRDIFPLPSLVDHLCFDSSPSSRFSIEGASRLVQLVNLEPLRGIRHADAARQPGIIDTVTSGTNWPRPSDCNARSGAPSQATSSGRDPGYITLMYRRYGPGIIITITVAPHHAFVIKRIRVGDLSWRRLFLARSHPSKMLLTARLGSQGIIDLESEDLTGCLHDL